MNKIKQKRFLNALKKNAIYKRLNKVTTMLPPPRIFTNRRKHTEDVVSVSELIKKDIIERYHIKRIYNFPESCYVHDLGHCCFAHETEEIMNDFIAEKLCICKRDVCFSHAVNGALVFALTAKPHRYKSELSKLNLFDCKKRDKDVDMIVDSMVKHSFKEYFLGSVYLNYIDREYRLATGISFLKRIKKKDEKPLYSVGHYVRVADDIASKNSDILNLIKLYYGKNISKKNTTYFDLAKKYISNLSNEVDKTYIKFNIEDLYDELELYKKQKAFLNVTYGFDYKKQFTAKSQQLVRNILEIVCNYPKIIDDCGFSRKYKFIRDSFEKDDKRERKERDILRDLNKIRIEFYNKPYDKFTLAFKLYYRYICSIVYQVSNFTEIDLIKFANHKSCFSKLSKTSKECAIWLKEKYHVIC